MLILVFGLFQSQPYKISLQRHAFFIYTPAAKNNSTLRRGLAEAAAKFAEPGLTKTTRYEKGRRIHDERANVLRGWRNGKPFRRPCRAVAADTFSGRISPAG